MQKKFQEIYENSINNPEKFWQEESEDIFWFKKPKKILIRIDFIDHIHKYS